MKSFHGACRRECFLKASSGCYFSVYYLELTLSQSFFYLPVKKKTFCVKISAFPAEGERFFPEDFFFMFL